MKSERPIPVIENWACVYSEECSFKAPERSILLVKGTVFGHSKYKDGKTIQTSCIREVEGKIIHTQNSTYRLGEPKKEWLDWMKENGIDFDPENPIRTKRA